MPAPWSQTSGHQNQEKIHSCFLSHPVYGILLWQLEWIQKGFFVFPDSFRGYPSRNICRPMRRIDISTRTRKMWFPALPDKFSLERENKPRSHRSGLWKAREGAVSLRGLVEDAVNGKVHVNMDSKARLEPQVCPGSCVTFGRINLSLPQSAHPWKGDGNNNNTSLRG